MIAFTTLMEGADLYEIIENLADEFPHEDLIFVDNPDRKKSYKVFREMIDILESMAADGARFKKKGLPAFVDGANISPKNNFVVKQLGSSQFSTHFS